MTHDELHFLLYLFLVGLFTFIFSALLCAFTLLIACPFVHASVLQNFFGYLFCCFFVAFFLVFAFVFAFFCFCCFCFCLLLLLCVLFFVAALLGFVFFAFVLLFILLFFSLFFCFFFAFF